MYSMESGDGSRTCTVCQQSDDYELEVWGSVYVVNKQGQHDLHYRKVSRAKSEHPSLAGSLEVAPNEVR